MSADPAALAKWLRGASEFVQERLGDEADADVEVFLAHINEAADALDSLVKERNAGVDVCMALQDENASLRLDREAACRAYDRLVAQNAALRTRIDAALRLCDDDDDPVQQKAIDESRYSVEPARRYHLLLVRDIRAALAEAKADD
jgi:hypothetical protein